MPRWRRPGAGAARPLRSPRPPTAAAVPTAAVVPKVAARWWRSLGGLVSVDDVSALAERWHLDPVGDDLDGLVVVAAQLGADGVVQRGGIGEVEGDQGEVAPGDVAGEGGRVAGADDALAGGMAGAGPGGQDDVAGGRPSPPLGGVDRQVVRGDGGVLD